MYTYCRCIRSPPAQRAPTRQARSHGTGHTAPASHTAMPAAARTHRGGRRRDGGSGATARCTVTEVRGPELPCLPERHHTRRHAETTPLPTSPRWTCEKSWAVLDRQQLELSVLPTQSHNKFWQTQTQAVAAASSEAHYRRRLQKRADAGTHSSANTSANTHTRAATHVHACLHQPSLGHLRRGRSHGVRHRTRHLHLKVLGIHWTLRVKQRVDPGTTMRDVGTTPLCAHPHNASHNVPNDSLL
jgi:hypothetical protein